MAMTPSFQDVFFQVTIAGGAGSGLFVYSPSAGAGNLIVSIAGAGGTDPYGNGYVQGIGIYGPSAEGLFVYSGAPALGNLVASVTSQGGTDSAGNGFIQGLTAYQSASIFANLLSGNLNLVSGASGWSLQADATASALGFFDTVNNGALFMADGASGSDGLCVVANQPGVLTTPETWHAVTVFGAGFAAGSPAPRYRLEPVGSAGVVRLDGVVSVTAATGATATMFTLPAGYHPARSHAFVTNNSTGTVPGGSVNVTTGGVVQCAPASANGDAVFLDGVTFSVD